MRALPLLLILAACGAPSSPGAPVAGGMAWGCNELELRNTAAVTVEQAYFSAAGQADWGQDLLAPATLPPGGVQRVRVRPGSSAARIVFANGRAAEMAGLDVCGAPVLVIQQNSLLAQR